MKNDLISIVIPCYNDWQYIQQAVDSALNQTYRYKEVIIVDDGSNVKTKKILKQLEPKIAKLLTQENHGQSKARNVGIKASKGDYILVLDSDDYFEPTFCEKALTIFQNDEEVKIVTCQANLLYEDGSTRIFIPYGGNISNFIYTSDALGTSMFKKIEWENCGCYDESMRKGFEDWEFFIRLLKKGGKVHVIQEPLYNYRKRSDSTTIKANTIKYDLLRYIYLKNRDVFISHFENFTEHLLIRIEREEKEKLKIYKKIDYRIGNMILKPFRFIKSKFKIKSV